MVNLFCLFVYNYHGSLGKLPTHSSIQDSSYQVWACVWDMPWHIYLCVRCYGQFFNCSLKIKFACMKCACFRLNNYKFLVWICSKHLTFSVIWCNSAIAFGWRPQLNRLKGSYNSKWIKLHLAIPALPQGYTFMSSILTDDQALITVDH